ncbi:hypothetical protein BKA80DRAFT_258028 [Phyllosticta citrichinensis]
MDSTHRCTVDVPNDKGKLNLACAQTYNAVCSCGRIFQIIPSVDNPATFQVLCQPPSQISRIPSLSETDLARILDKPQTASMEHGNTVGLAIRSTEAPSATRSTEAAGGSPRTPYDNCANYVAVNRGIENISSPFRLWSTELVEGVAEYLDNKDLFAFRASCARIASQVDYPFRKRFGSVEYTIADSQPVNAAKFDRLRQFRRSRLADEVRTLTFIEREKGGFPILNKSLPGYEDGDIRFFTDDIRIPMTFVNSLDWFSKLETLILSSDYVARERVIPRITPSTEDYNSVFKSLEQLLRKRQTPLQVQVRHRDLISCDFNWTGKRETTDNISFRSLKTRTAIEGEFREMIVLSLDPNRECFYNYEIKRYGVQLQDTLLKHRLRVIKLSGFTFRIIDLSDLFCSQTVLPAPETLVLENCQLRFDAEPYSGHTTVRWTHMRAFIEDLGRAGVRHLEILDVRLNVAPQMACIPLFQLIRKYCRLKSFRFERVDRVFFDWDSDNQWDDGRRLPEMIRKLGGVNRALREMEKCIRYKRILHSCYYAEEEKKQEEEDQDMEEQEEEKQESGKKDAERQEEEDEDRYDLPDEYFGF